MHRKLHRSVTEIRRFCLNYQIDYLQLGTHQRIESVLTAYLGKRSKMMK